MSYQKSKEKDRLQEEEEKFKIILEDTEDARTGRGWLILMILFTAIVHSYSKRNQILSEEELENFDLLEQIDLIITDWEEQIFDELDQQEREKLESRIKALRKTRNSRNKLGHSERLFDLDHFKKWSQAWVKSAEALLRDTPGYKRNAEEKRNDNIRLNRMKKACLALVSPIRRDKFSIQSLKEAFKFALPNTNYAKAARSFFILITIIHPSLKECAANTIYKRGNEENKDISTLLRLLVDEKQTSFLNKRDPKAINKLFFGKKPTDDVNWVREIINMFGHNTECSTRPDNDYNEMAITLRTLLIEIKSDEYYVLKLKNGAKYLLDIQEIE